MFLVIGNAESYNQVGEPVMALLGEQGTADLHGVIVGAGESASRNMAGVIVQESQIEADIMTDDGLGLSRGVGIGEPGNELGGAPRQWDYGRRPSRR